MNFAAFCRDMLTPPPPFDLSIYRRWFEIYDRSHEPNLGPEPTKAQILAVADICRAEGRLMADALYEAAETVKS